jgi:hypothetical protein
MLLVCIGVGTGVGLSGGLLSIAIIITLLFLILILLNYQFGIWLSLLLIPFSNTHILPRQMFGVTGLNPFNILLSVTLLVFFVVFISNHTRNKPIIPKYPYLFWLFVLPIVLSALYGTRFVSNIPEYYRTIEILKFDSVGGYIADTLLKPLIIIITSMMMATSIRNSPNPALYILPVFLSAAILGVIVVIAVIVSGVSLRTLASAESRDFLSFTGMHANELGLFFNMSFALALYLWTGTNRAAFCNNTILLIFATPN